MAAAKRTPAPEELLPLRPVETLILTMLTAGERHGYGIRQDILEHTAGQIELEAGNLYRHMRRIEAASLIEPAPRPTAAASDDPRRIYYKMTGFGRRVLAAEMLRMRDLVRLAESRRVIAPGPA